jgi:hypothetical protein
MRELPLRAAYAIRAWLQVSGDGIARVVATACQHAQIRADLRQRDDVGEAGERSLSLARRRAFDQQCGAGQRVHQLARAAIGDELAMIENRQAMAAFGFVHQMRRHENRRAGIDEIEQRVPEFTPRLRIDRAGRFVEQEQVGLVQHRRGQGEALFLPARQRAGEPVAQVAEPVALEQFPDARGCICARELMHGGNEVEVLVDREVFVQGKPLRHVTDAALELLGLLGNPETEHFDLACGRQQQAAQHADRRRLARAVRTEETINLRAADVEVEVVDRDDIAELARQPACANRQFLSFLRLRGKVAGAWNGA